jgi:hypothetical protein
LRFAHGALRNSLFLKKKILRPDFFNGYGKFTALQLKEFGEISLILNSGGVTNK